MNKRVFVYFFFIEWNHVEVVVVMVRKRYST